MFSVFLLVLMILPNNGEYQSVVTLSSQGQEFQPRNSIQLILTTSMPTVTGCFAACNQLLSCRLFDYDSVSLRCRLFEGDSTTGSIISSSSSTSLVGMIRISSTLYSLTHNQPCQACQQNRYEVCSANTSACQCPPHTYWDGSVCALQLFENDQCNLASVCRSDLNLICGMECYGGISKCVSSLVTYTANSTTASFGITVAGICNSSSTANQTTLNAQSGIRIDPNGTLYLGDNSNRLFAFINSSYQSHVLRSFSTWPTFVYFDNRTSYLYVTVMLAHLVYIWPTNKTIPNNGIPGGNCSLNSIYYPTGIVIDSVGNAYISSYYCSWVTKWAPNANSGTLIAGSSLGYAGSDSQSMYLSYNLALDESNSFIYVVDRYNHRVQRFPLSGSGIGVTVAGGNGQGSAANQLNRPTDIYLSKVTNSFYIADCYNNRVQKWQLNSTYGVTVAGSPNGTSGHTPFLMATVYSLTIDSGENYLYVSDSGNNRIQRFSLH